MTVENFNDNLSFSIGRFSKYIFLILEVKVSNLIVAYPTFFYSAN